jgi:ABC-type bacteriocin/lantibiotic exporter with double-glycine peptidase domain
MSLIDQVKSNTVYYRAIKISVIAIVSGLAFFLLVWIGIWLKVDEVRSGGMILFAISIFVAFASYLFALAYALLFALRKLLNSRKAK